MSAPAPDLSDVADLPDVPGAGVGRPVLSTYRFQLRPEFGFADALAVVDHLADLGVSHAYLSPVLTASPGSTHGYDVVDHSRINPELGGEEGLRALADALHARGLGVIADVVPNHMAVPSPLWHNRAMWSVLRDGPGSTFARWLDVDWTVPQRAVLMPVLGSRIGEVLDAGELRLAREEVPVGEDGAVVTETVLRYFDHVLPVRAGTEDLPMAELVDQQWYRLAHWRVADEELNYRRFFDVDTLAAVRVEDEAVFEATHRVLLDLFSQGVLDGFRIDHPDGLADPRGYLRRLSAARGPAGQAPYVVVEKILEGEEALPADWPCDGTTGYETLRRITGVLVNPFAEAPLTLLHHEIGTSAGAAVGDYHELVDTAKREVVQGGQYAEVHRLVDLLVDICADDIHLRDHTRRALHDSVVELLVAMERYRAYVVPGEEPDAEAVAVLSEAAHRARERLPEDRQATLDLVTHLVLGRDLVAGSSGALAEGSQEQGGADGLARRRELVVRFQQTCGPVMAKGVEDTAFYRWQRFVALNEVGGDPARFGITPEELHAAAERTAATWPSTMTTLSTHDTKRSEDARARLLAAVEDPERWVGAVRGWHEAAAPLRQGDLVDGDTELLLWQTLVATWPVTEERLVGYLEKATREAKLHTTWTSPDEAYEGAVTALAAGVLADPDLSGDVASFVEAVQPWTRATTLAQKALQLVLPGVPDVYQGTETVDRSLVDPDNRRAVDYEDRRARLAHLDGGGEPRDLDDEKLLVTSRALRLRRDLPAAFVGPDAGYEPVATSTGNAFALGRGPVGAPEVVLVVTRRPGELDRLGGWGRHTVSLPEGRWVDVLTGTGHEGGGVPASDLLDRLPVALLRRA
ncbi:malto-oligosyltrehalose synthase [Aquipuribacter hungaricus]|uniref:Malto-oligosyltrehalose synthase n=1 Tax=Aquipuribacter hungaricus TaxID=545624 RepID=A0ABV7WED0_9MICO